MAQTSDIIAATILGRSSYTPRQLKRRGVREVGGMVCQWTASGARHCHYGLGRGDF